MKDIAMFGGFKGAEHSYSEVFFISSHLKMYIQ